MKKGQKHTKESKKKIGLASAKRKHTEETKNKIRIARVGKKHTKKTKEKIRKSLLRNYYSNNN